jgi:hypothetical protein
MYINNTLNPGKTVNELYYSIFMPECNKYGIWFKGINKAEIWEKSGYKTISIH